MDGWMVGWMDGGMGGGMDAWMDGWLDFKVYVYFQSYDYGVAGELGNWIW